MANTSSQATQIRDLLLERLEAYDPTLDLAVGGTAYEQIVGPVFSALSIDPFDTDIEEFLKTRLRQEFPTLSVQNGDAVVDIVIRPLQLLLESFKREIQIIRTGQSVRNANQMRLQDAEDLAANFFVTRKSGSRASGTVRVFFAVPTFVSILVSTQFSAGGLRFFPTVPQFFRPEVIAAQRSGNLYYVDIPVIAEAAGEAYNIAANAISSVVGLESAVRVTNLIPFLNGTDEETGPELLTRTRASLTERSLNTRRGIRARIFSDFPSVRNLEVVGFGDPEMQRDKITGAGGGDVICSGMSLVLGRYMFLLSMFENRGRDGARRIQDGGTIDLNFWNFLYGTQSVVPNQRFLVEKVLYESSSDLEGVPTVYLLRLNQSPEVDSPPGSMIPGLLPGIFAVAYDRAEIRISGIPGGITNPDDADEIVIRDDQVHIGGHYDVYVRPTRSNQTSTSFRSAAGEVAVLEGSTLCTSSDAEIPVILRTYGAVPNKVNARLRLNLVSISGTFVEGEAVHLLDGAAVQYDTGGLAINVSIPASATGEPKYIELTSLTRDNVWQAEYSIVGYTSGATAVIGSVEQTIWEDAGVTRGMTLTVINSPDNGNYKILDVRGPELVLNAAMTVLGRDFRFRVVDEVVVDAFEPRAPIFPFAGQSATDLRTVIGVATVRISADLISFGVQVGDVLEILNGSNIGQYRITGFDPVLRGRAPILESAMTATDSNVTYQVFSAGSGLSRPLIRISPRGMTLQTANGQSSGYSVPPALPVGARAVEGFSGAREVFRGINGFVFPDAGVDWAPTANISLKAYNVGAAGAVSPTTGARSPAGTILKNDLITIDEYSGGRGPGTCYSSECLPTDDDFIAVITLASDPTAPAGHAVQNHLSINLPPEVKTFLGTIRTWLSDLTGSFDLGDDFRAFFDLFAPFSLDPIPETYPIIAQYEVLIPRAMFDGCNNIFFAMPEFDWKAAFTEGTTFSDAMDLYNNGEIRNSPAALSHAKSGDVLTIDSGANAGSYVIDKVYTYKIYHGGSILTSGSTEVLDDRAAYTFAIVKIKNEFPVNPFQGLSSFTPSATPALSLSGPSLNVTSIVASGPSAGDAVSPWLIVQESFTWLFQLLSSAGYDLPDQLVVNPASVLQKLVAGFFDSYVVGHPTAEQTIRLYFTEPTSVTAFGPTSCAEYVWNEPDIALAGSAGISFPVDTALPAVEGTTLAVTVQLIDGTVTTLSAEVPEEADDVALTKAGRDAFVGILQAELDPSAETVIIGHVWDESEQESQFYVAAAKPDQGVRLTIQAATAADTLFLLGFTDIEAESVASLGEEQTTSVHPHAPTIFSVPVGAEQLLFVAAGTELPYQVVPGSSRGTRVTTPTLPRDIIVYPHYDHATAFKVIGTDLLLPAFMNAGVQAGTDQLHIHEQKVLLEVTGETAGKEDRVAVVTTQAGSSILRLPRLTSGTSEFTMLAPSSGAIADTLRVGDYVFIEEGDGKGGYQITEVGADYVAVDAVMPATTAHIYRSGNDGSISAGGETLTDANAPFSSEDVGRYLTIYLSNYAGVDGSYQILSVSADKRTVTLELEGFEVTETGLHWSVVRAPIDELLESTISGATELIGVRPVRFYSGVPSAWRIVDVHATSERSDSTLICAYAGSRFDSPFDALRDLTGLGPVRGVKQPYEIIRPNVVHISSTEMAAQGTDAGLYYMDVRAISLGGRPIYNIPKDTELTPVFGTYESDGYRLEVEDTLYTYSSAERCKIYFSSSFLPSDLDDTIENKILLNGASFVVQHEVSAEVGQVQALLSSNLNRTLCADPLARHFLPSYVYLDIEVAGGNRLKVAQDIANYINGLEPTDALDVSLIEKFLHSNNVGSYRHPINLQIVTHDLDRRRVLTRSSDRIGVSERDFYGSHRTTFYIPGTPATTESSPGQERILVKAPKA
jgi:hypothetical protein